MKIGVLMCGPVAPELVGRFGEYDRVYGDWLSAHDPSLEFQGWAAHEGEIPSAPDEADAWLLSGSKYGVYEDYDWLPRLKAFIRRAADAKRPMIGICFGHQVMAEALGGRAEKWRDGWNVGRRAYDAPGLGAPGDEVILHAVHQDQVTTPPPGARTVMSAPGCACAALVYGDPDKPHAISIQPHPEFGDDFMADLVEVRRGVFPEDQAAATVGGFGGRLDRDWAAKWFLSFLRAGSA